MSWHFSRALVEAYSEANCLGIELFALLKSSDMPEAYCWHDRGGRDAEKEVTG